MNPKTPAFPNHPAIHSEFGAAYGQPGMTLRQYAAIQIAAGISAANPNVTIPENLTISASALLSRAAIEIADVLLAELAKEAK